MGPSNHPKYVLLCKSGKEFTAEHANWLSHQLNGQIYVLTDLPREQFIPPIQTIPLKFNWGGWPWWSKMEIFRPDILNFSFIYMDLDTVIKTEIPHDWFNGDKITVTRPFRKEDKMEAGFMFIPQEKKEYIWKEWIANPGNHIKMHRGDANFLTQHVSAFDFFPEDSIASYKFTKNRLATANVVCFHGVPRPWNVNEPWVPKLNEFIVKNKTSCIVVGNGPSVFKKDYGDMIDSFENVIRLNKFITEGYEKNVGKSTTIWATFGGNILPSDRARPKNVILAHQNNTLLYNPNNIWRIPMAYYTEKRNELQKNTTRVNSQIIPSTGYLLIRWLLEHGVEPTVVGFDHFSKKDSGLHHYWNKQIFVEPAEHDGAAEKKLLEPYVTSNRLRYLQ